MTVRVQVIREVVVVTMREVLEVVVRGRRRRKEVPQVQVVLAVAVAAVQAAVQAAAVAAASKVVPDHFGVVTRK